MAHTFFAPGDIIQAVVTVSTWKSLQDFVVLESLGEDRYLLRMYDESGLGQGYEGTIGERYTMSFPGGVELSEIHYRQRTYRPSDPAANSVDMLATAARRHSTIISDI